MPDEELPNIGDQAVGLVTSGIYSADATRPANKEFVAAFHKEYGDKSNPDFETADAWNGMRMIYELVIKTKGKFTGDEAMDFFKTWKSESSPKGPVMIDPATRNIVQNVYMRRVEKQGGKLADVEFDTLGMMNALGQPYAAAK